MALPPDETGETFLREVEENLRRDQAADFAKKYGKWLIGGVILGWFLYTAFGGDGSRGIDWVRWLIAIAVAAVLVILADMIVVRSRTRRTQA